MAGRTSAHFCVDCRKYKVGIEVESSRQANYELLIADDDPGFRETLKHIFEPHFHTVEASCGEEVIEIVQRREVHLILMDMHMQHLTGLDTCRIVVQEMNLILPCILITADATDELRRDAAELHVYSVLAKPVRRADLITTVTTAIVDRYHDPDVRDLLHAAS
ncbi:MAG: response regulator [Planctomycetales bacterium]|nr:response regulator [Planctomycetales bacterium]